MPPRRGSSLTVGDLAAQLGGNPRTFALKASFESMHRAGAAARAGVTVYLSARNTPHVEVHGALGGITDDLRFTWVDGQTRQNSARLPRLQSLAALPAWLKAVERQQRLRWNRTPLYLMSSLRGGARTRLLGWLFG